MATGSPVSHANNPFYEASVLGSHSWGRSSLGFGYKGSGSDDLVKLNDTDNPFGPTSGAIKLVVKAGWEVGVTIRTGNFNYFDNIQTSSIITFASGQELKTTLRGGDWLSIDVDSKWSGINTFTLRNPSRTWTNQSAMGLGPLDGSAWVLVTSVNREQAGGASPAPASPESVVHEEEDSVVDNFNSLIDDVKEQGSALDDTLTKYGVLIVAAIIGIAVIKIT